MNSPFILDTDTVWYAIGDGSLEKSRNRLADFHRVIILVDENTEKFCLPVLLTQVPELASCNLIRVTSGEKNKNIAQSSYIWNELTRLNASRDTLLVNLGGGVLTDSGGFAAATFKRGMRFLNIPTTLLGMVDAAIGGKTGVDFHDFKNQVGLFVNPVGMIAEPLFLKTLEEKQWQSGFAEVIKYALIMDRELWSKLEGNRYAEIVDWNPIIVKSARNKIDIVRFDAMEKGVRKNLNFGHTIGHALESYYLKSFNEITHGMAIAAGMICEAWISSKVFEMECPQLDEIVQLIDANFERLDFERSNIPSIIALMQQDKKMRANKLLFSLLRKIGKASHDIEVDEKLIEESLYFYIDKKKCNQI
ncbi:MAG: 3-dehydroquinate synthase [Bacteroidetes bacterium]|nr:3-dehydroquinate synthase [Bacteroidota bacterium]